MAFPPRFLDELRQRVSLAEIVGRRVKLVRRGREYVGLCPFHNEKTPSFSAVEDKGFYHCFGCGAHGDVIGFVMQTESLSFPEAVEQLARQAGLEVPQESREERERAARQASVQSAVDAACAYFEKMLHGAEGRAARAYLERRGLDEETVRRFRLGYAPPFDQSSGGRDALRRALAQDIPEALLIEAGLLRKAEGGGEAYDYFRDRVIFPIGDRRGRIIAFGGRVMGDGQPKYLNSPDTPLFQKGRVLYGWALARAGFFDADRARSRDANPARATGVGQAAVARAEIIVVEGYMDVIALHRAGFATAVAPLGTALTEAQLEELWRLAPEPILCFDGDAAGQRAASRALARALPILKPGLSLRFAVLPAGEDPDSLTLHHGAEAMRTVLDRARPLAEVLWSIETAQPTDTPERRAALEQRLDRHVRLIADRSVQEHYRRFFRERLAESFAPRRAPIGAAGGVPPAAGRLRRGRAGWGQRLGALPLHEPAPARDPALLQRRREEVLLALILNHPFLLSEILEDLSAIELGSPDLDRLSGAIQKAHLVQPDLEAEALRRYLTDNGFGEIVEKVLSPEVLVHGGFARLEADADAARNGWNHMKSQLQRRLSSTELKEAVAHCVADTTPQSWDRVEQLQRAELESKDRDDGVA
ncbi:MAG TPA: DNA primase [Stellaceae bacterium]|nr:DNA primase [Stellaceae bacterium]